MINRKKLLVLLIILISTAILVYINIFDDNYNTDVKVAGSKVKLNVYSSFYPLYDLARQIGGSKTEVEVIIPVGSSAHSYRPSPRQIAALEKADLFFYIGLGIEPWLDRAVVVIEESDVRAVQLSAGLELLSIDTSTGSSIIESGEHDESTIQNEENEYHHGNHGHSGDEDHYDPHVWLDPLNMSIMAETVKEELIRKDPDNRDYYEENYLNYIEKIEKLHKEYEMEIGSRIENSEDRFMMVSHAAFAYLAERYDLRQIAVSGIAPHEEPSPGTLAGLTKLAREYNLEYIFMERLEASEIAEVLAEEADLEVMILNTISGLTPEQQQTQEDYFSLMRENLYNLKKVFGD